MADSNSALGPLPNGWECRNDPRTRRNYFINYNNKTTTWDDPRASASMFTSPPPYHEPGEIITLQEVTNYRPSPVPSRAHTAPLMGSHAIGHHSSSKIHETSFSNALATEQSVAKISAMFPTVSETHIRALLIKYHSREAVVISALQVEKNPLTTPGPFSTPPLTRHIIIPPSTLPPNYHSTPPSGLRDFASTPPPSLYSYGYGTGGTLTGSLASSSIMGSPAIRHSPRAHSSPKMKLRYMKSMFPKADETVILDTLYNVDNNVLAATNQLQSMGFDKRDSTLSLVGTPSTKIKEAGKAIKNEKVVEKVISTLTASARLKSAEEKQGMRDRLKKKHPDLAEQLILMALDSVEYDENKASHILNVMIKEESTPKSTHPNSASSSQRPQSSKSTDGEVSSLGTKTTVEADLAVYSNQKPEEEKCIRQDNSISSQKLRSAPEQTIKAEMCLIDSSEHPGFDSEQSDTILSTKETVHIFNKAFATNGVQNLHPKKTSIRKTKGKKEVPKVSRGTSTTEDKEYRSSFRGTPVGSNSMLLHGPNDELLIEEYVAWSGPSRRSEIRTSIAKGPNKNLLRSQGYNTKGPNQEICKGPQKGLAKGSLYSKLAACNTSLVVVESRGK